MIKKIMVVDDDPDIALSVKRGLEGLGEDFEVTCVSSGIDCIETLKNNQVPDLILLDIMMPGMSGWELQNRLRENSDWGKIPIVFLTAKTDSFSKTFGKTISMDYVEKPFEIEDLGRRIKNILKKINSKYPGFE